MRDHYEQLYANKLVNWKNQIQFYKYTILGLNHKEIETLNRPIMRKEINW